MKKAHELIQIEDYEPFIGKEAVKRILQKAKRLRGLHVTHVNSTYYGGGVATLLSSLTLLMNSLGLKTGWRVLQGEPDFFTVTKKMHHALQGGEIHLSKRKKEIYEKVAFENSVRNHLEHHDVVIVHDPQPLPLIRHYPRRGLWIWRCHVDLTRPDPKLWNYLKTFVEKYDAVIFSLKDYRKKLRTPQFFMMPAIDPFTLKNRALTEKEMQERLRRYKIPTDLPLVVQVSRFDHWKDPQGVIDAFRLASRKVKCRLVLIGQAATDDPEGQEVYESILKERDDKILISHCGDDSGLINALQRKAAVVIQKSIREGFGLTVAEAMWKRSPVIGGDVGGIRYQIKDGSNGFLVSSVKECADRIVTFLKNQKLCQTMGEQAYKTIREKFLLSRYLEQYLDLFQQYDLKPK